MTAACELCGVVLASVRDACAACHRGRSRADIEVDALVAMACIPRVRRKGVATLRFDDFGSSRNRALFSALQAAPVDPVGVDEWWARTVGVSVPEALAARMEASPVTWEHDLWWLAEHR